jgi:glycosyltransferase involved in cell wall biosynthesis
MLEIRNMNLSIVIPCLNEKKTIKKAIFEVLKFFKKSKNSNFEIIIADNGSTDGSLEIIKKLAKIKNIKFINVVTRGYGAALHAGILSAKYPYVLFADADLSYSFKQVSVFKKQTKNSFDLVLGSRFKGKIHDGSMPFLHRYLGTPILTFLINLIYKINTTDCNSGMRMIKKSFYTQLNMKNSGMEWASELLIKTALNKGKYKEVPISLFPDKRGRKPHLNSWKDGWRHLKVIILLKPSIFLSSALLIFILGLLSSTIFNTMHYFFVSTILSEFLVYSYLVLKKLEAAISKVDNFTNQFLNSLPLVFIGILFWPIIMFFLFYLPASLITLKYAMLFQIVIYSIWLFFIETINTHLINQLEN